MRIGMGCKAQTTDIAVAMARICNAADRPRPRLHTREEIVNTFYQVTPLARPKCWPGAASGKARVYPRYKPWRMGHKLALCSLKFVTFCKVIARAALPLASSP